MLLEKINQKVDEINSYKMEYEETAKKLAQATQTEIINRFGIMEGSFLKIDLIEAKNFNNYFVPYIVIIVGNQTKSTKTLKRTQFPIWNEELLLYFLLKITKIVI